MSASRFALSSDHLRVERRDVKIAVIMTCFNRKALTLGCLEALWRAIEFCRNSVEEYRNLSVDVWLNDDVSTDGTSEAVQEWFKSPMPAFHLHLICGSGHDYWCGGMRRAWQSAVASGKKYDGYLWLNDDVCLDRGGLILMLERPESLMAGAICSRDRSHYTYGGFDGRGDKVAPNGGVQRVTTFNGNCVWIPKAVYEQIGGLSRHWSHSLGDVDYGRRATEVGLEVYLTRDYVGTCDDDAQLPSCFRPEVPFLRRIKNLYSPLSYAIPTELFRYCWIHDGPCVATKNFIMQHFHAAFPKLWRML